MYHVSRFCCGLLKHVAITPNDGVISEYWTGMYIEGSVLTLFSTSTEFTWSNWGKRPKESQWLLLGVEIWTRNNPGTKQRSCLLERHVQFKGHSTRALKTRRLKRPTKRVVTPTELSMRGIYKNARSNLDERFWRLQFDVSPASSVSSAVGGVVNASVRNAVQSTLGVSFGCPSAAFQGQDVRFREIYLRGRGAASVMECSVNLLTPEFDI
jgi:hypothetical protein